MKISMIDAHGRLLNIIEVQTFDLKSVSVPAPYFIIGYAPESPDYYWDGGAFIPLGDPPDDYSYFDYATKEWVDPRTLDDLKDQKWEELKQQRNALEISGFVFEGQTYDSDQVSQGRIMGAAMAGVDQVWTLADNTVVALSSNQVKQLYEALQQHIASAHERGRIARQLIYKAETREQVDAVSL